MNWSETICTAYEAIRTRRLRSGLTVLGILIGIAAVMLTVGLGQGAQAKVAAQINQLGSNLLIVSPGSTTSSTGLRGGRGSATTLTSDDAAMLGDKRVAPDVAAVAPVSTSSQSLTVGTTNWTTSVVGTTPDWLSVRARTLSSGRFITQGDLNGGTLVTVIGATTASELYGGRDPVGQSVTINNQSFTVIGVLASAGSSTTSDEDDQAIAPRTTFATRVSTTANSRSVSTIYLQAADQSSLSAAYQEANAALLTSHGAPPRRRTSRSTVSSRSSPPRRAPPRP